MRKNEISDLKEINFLKHLPKLNVLWLSENPISAHPNYRMYVLNKLPNLQKLDEVDVSPEEVEAASSMEINDEDLDIGRNEPSYPPPAQEPVEEYSHKEPYNYESPNKPPSYEMNDISQPSQPPVQRSPPTQPPEEIKQPSYSQMPEQPPAPHGMGSNPGYWSKGPTGGDIYAGGAPSQNFDMPPKVDVQRPQKSGPYYAEAPPLRYGMNETGSYLPPQPRLMHAHSTPVGNPVSNAGPGIGNGGKYKNENIL